MSTMPLPPYPFPSSIQAGFSREAHGKTDEAPASGSAKADEDLLELTIPAKTAEDIPWDSRLSYIPHKHRWPT